MLKYLIDVLIWWINLSHWQVLVRFNTIFIGSGLLFWVTYVYSLYTDTRVNNTSHQKLQIRPPSTRFTRCNCYFHRILFIKLHVIGFYTVAQKWHIFVRLIITSSNTDRFSNFFTIRIRRKFVVVLSRKIPLHLNCVATLPCEMSVS